MNPTSGSPWRRSIAAAIVAIAVFFALGELVSLFGLEGVIGRQIRLGGLDFTNLFIMLANPPAEFKGPLTYDALTKAGVPLFAYGSFITVALNFLILGFIIFMMVRQINRMKTAAPPPPPAPTPEDVVLLREIRDALKR